MKLLIIIAIIILILTIVAFVFLFRFLLKTVKKGLNFANSTLDKDHKFKIRKKNNSYGDEINSLFNNVKKHIGIFDENDEKKLHDKIERQEIEVEIKLDEFKVILDKKFKREELTYLRFLDSVTKVHTNILDSLEIIKHKYQILENMDVEDVNRRLKYLSKKNTHGENKELEAIQRRKNIIQNELKQIDKLLASNEDALTSIDNMKLKLVNLNIARESKELEESIEQLNKMATRVKNYE